MKFELPPHTYSYVAEAQEKRCNSFVCTSTECSSKQETYLSVYRLMLSLMFRHDCLPIEYGIYVNGDDLSSDL